MGPMLLKPVGKDYLWGGTRLKEEYNKDIDLTPLAETWECSTHPDGKSIVANGEFKGKALADVIKEHPEYLGTKHDDIKELPIMVKLIDAKEKLSLQVHPDDKYSFKHEKQRGKTEMWYVLDAEPGAKLMYGFAHPVNKDILKYAVEDGSLSKHIQKVKVQKNDVFFIPPGTIHAIGAGILIVEIQQCSNVTYRVYDYNRIDKNGKKRQLHFDKAIDVMNMEVSKDIRQNPRILHYYPGCSRELLCRCKYFEVERIQVSEGFEFSVMDTSFQILMIINGMAVLNYSNTDKPLSISKGDCLFLPSALGRCSINGRVELLKIRC